jgi:hypothetical protein
MAAENMDANGDFRIIGAMLILTRIFTAVQANRFHQNAIEVPSRKYKNTCSMAQLNWMNRTLKKQITAHELINKLPINEFLM